MGEPATRVAAAITIVVLAPCARAADDVLYPELEPLYHWGAFTHKEGAIQWMPVPVPHGKLGSLWHNVKGWYHVRCSTHNALWDHAAMARKTHYLFKPSSEYSSTGPARDDNQRGNYWRHGDIPGMLEDFMSRRDPNATDDDPPCHVPHRVGARLLSIRAYGARSVTVLGRQNGTDHTLQPRAVPSYLANSWCEFPQVFYAAKDNPTRPLSVQGIFDQQALQHVARVFDTRTKVFWLQIAAYVAHTMLVRMLGAPPPEPLKPAT